MIARTLAQTGYRFGAVIMDARWFVPQSRPRVFVVGWRGDLEGPAKLSCAVPSDRWVPPMPQAA